MSKLRRITNDNYIKSGNEIQENLTNEDIEVLLEDYNEVEDIKDLKVGIHIRYYLIKIENGKQFKLFRMGGNIIKIDPDYRYVVLSNGSITWSVQIKNTIFYKKMSMEEIKEFYENELDNKDVDINKYKNYIIKLKENYNKLQEDYDLLKLEYKKLKKKLNN